MRSDVGMRIETSVGTAFRRGLGLKLASCFAVLAVLAALAALLWPASSAVSSNWAPVSIAAAYERATIVCLLDVFEFVKAPPPTAEVQETWSSHRAWVTHVWKGDPPDTLLLAGKGRRVYDPTASEPTWIFAATGPQVEKRGRRYVAFVWVSPQGLAYTSDHSAELSDGAAELLWLARNHGAPRSTVLAVDDPPEVSFELLTRESEEGDSTTAARAFSALGQLADSAGVVVRRLKAVVDSPAESWRRQLAVNVLGAWSSTDRSARQALLRLLDRGDDETQLMVLVPHRFAVDDELRSRFFEHREDPSPEVRAAALARGADLLTSSYPPIRAYTDALRDPSPRVRESAMHALGSVTGHQDQISDALERCLDDPDPEVARLVQRLSGNLLKRGAER